MSLLEAINLRKAYGGRTVVDGASNLPVALAQHRLQWAKDGKVDLDPLKPPLVFLCVPRLSSTLLWPQSIPRVRFRTLSLHH